ncbi:MAG TPA: PAS domain S-box protein, partial [Candidatus Eisenbacteria bacterium]|nr:PAS domain S-box protein [Candidatus Eisenbacteria bacterium]
RLVQQYSDSFISDQHDRQLLDTFRESNRQFIDAATQVIGLAEDERTDEAVDQLKSTVVPEGNGLATALAEWIQYNKELGSSAAQTAQAAIDDTRSHIVAANSVALLLTAILGALTVRRILKPIQALDRTVKTIAAGDYTKAVPFTEATDETGSLARSIEVLKRGSAEIDDQRWVKSNASTVVSELQRAGSLRDFADRLLSGLMPLLGGGVAGFYVFDEAAGRLERAASYGLSAGAQAAVTFELGEGLVGQSARDRKPVALDSLPPDYLRIESGLGAAPPAHVLASPLVSKTALLGVVETATFHSFDSRQRALLAEMMPVVAMSMEILQQNLGTQQLLGRTQEQARELEDTERFFRSVLELAPDGLMVVDAKGAIQLANARCEQLFGYTRDEFIGQSVDMLVPLDVRGGHDALRAGFHRAPTAREMGPDRELRAVRKDGSEFPVEIGLSPLPARGPEGRQVAVSIRDVTERKDQEKALKLAKARAEEATQTKSMFLANMSHEIRTPMNAILNMTSLALEADLPPKPHQFVSVAHSSAKNLLGILNDILDFSKIEADKLQLENAPFSLREILEEVTEMF